MLQASFDTHAAQQRLNDMQVAIHDLAEHGMQQELRDWQVEDMKRRFPNTEDPTFLSSETTIWPRSRTYEQTHKNRVRTFRKPMSALPRLVGTLGRPGTSHRPILRPALYERLIERMGALMARTLTWRSTSPS